MEMTVDDLLKQVLRQVQQQRSLEAAIIQVGGVWSRVVEEKADKGEKGGEGSWVCATY